MATQSLLKEPTLDNTVGAAFLGVAGACFLFGITTLQAYWYYHSYPRDTRLHKCSVAVLWQVVWAVDTLHLALTIHAAYIYVVKGFGNELGFLNIVWSIKLQVFLNVVIILMVHSLYAVRVWRLGGYHHGVLGYLVALVVAGGSAIGIVLAYYVYTVDTFLELEKVSWVVNSSLATATAIDFVIAGTMCYYLMKSKRSVTRLNSRISVVMQYTLSSGLMTSACSLSAMFSYILLPNTFIFLGVEFLLTKRMRFYVLSFLAMLNARRRKEGSDEESSANSNSRRPFKLGVTSSFWSPSPASDASTINSDSASKVPPWQSWDANIPRPVVL